MTMRLDVDDHAAVTDISVLTSMMNLDLLEGEECVDVCELIFMENRAVSHAAGQFAVSYFFSADFMERARRKAVPPGVCGLSVSVSEVCMYARLIVCVYEVSVCVCTCV